MKAFAAALVAAFLLLLAGCATKADLMALEIQDRAHERTVKFNDDSETRAARAWIEVQKEREKTRQLEAQAAITRAGAIMKIAEKADAGGRVAIARSLEERAPSGAAAAADVPVPRAALMQVPVIQPPKSAVDKWIDAGAKAWGLLNDTTRILVSYKGLGKQLDADVRRTQLAEEGQTARHGATMGAFGRFSDNQTTLGVAGVNGVRDVGVAAANAPNIVNNVTGTGNKVNIGGRDANFDDETTTTTTNTVKCPQRQDSRTGDTGNGAPAGTTTTGQSQGGTSGPTGQTASTQSANCNAGK